MACQPLKKQPMRRSTKPIDRNHLRRGCSQNPVSIASQTVQHQSFLAVNVYLLGALTRFKNTCQIAMPNAFAQSFWYLSLHFFSCGFFHISTRYLGRIILPCLFVAQISAWCNFHFFAVWHDFSDSDAVIFPVRQAALWIYVLLIFKANHWEFASPMLLRLSYVASWK